MSEQTKILTPEQVRESAKRMSAWFGDVDPDLIKLTASHEALRSEVTDLKGYIQGIGEMIPDEPEKGNCLIVKVKRLLAGVERGKRMTQLTEAEKIQSETARQCAEIAEKVVSELDFRLKISGYTAEERRFVMCRRDDAASIASEIRRTFRLGLSDAREPNGDTISQ